MILQSDLQDDLSIIFRRFCVNGEVARREENVKRIVMSLGKSPLSLRNLVPKIGSTYIGQMSHITLECRKI